jgi:hypothetical protein
LSAGRSIAFGVFFAVAAVYILTGPGRIDIIDGQMRYDVALSLHAKGRPTLRDPALRSWGRPGLNGQLYAPYGVGGSLAGLPMVAMADFAFELDPGGERSRFAFSLTSAVWGAAACALLLLFYLQLGIRSRPALGWTLVCAFATLLWPLAASTFTHAQTALLVTAALLLGDRSARRASLPLAAAAGVCAGAIVIFDEYLVLLVPFLALSTLGAPSVPRLRRLLTRTFARDEGDGTPRLRFWIFAASSLLGVLAHLAYNHWRFGSPFISSRHEPPPLGNPLAGLVGLTVSPGKGILWYSPTIVLTVVGLRGLWLRAPHLAAAIAGATAALLVFLSPVQFFGGDWCWGPRYLALLVPAWALAWPFAEGRLATPAAKRVLVMVGLTVQLLGLSIDHQRFFFERALPDHFWRTDRWFYLRASALLARPGEIARSIAERHIDRPQFLPAPYRLLTYCIFGNDPARRFESPEWMQRFAGFYLPRPWPLWMTSLPPSKRPFSVEKAASLMIVLGFLGALLAYTGLKRSERESS